MRRLIAGILVIGFVIAGCSISEHRNRGVYVLLAVARADSPTRNENQELLNTLLTLLRPDDILAVARIDTRSFSERDIIAEIRFDQRPSAAIRQKRAFKDRFDNFFAHASGHPAMDLTGGILQAIEYLNSSRCAHKYILLFSDLKQEPIGGDARHAPFQLSGFTVIGLHPAQAQRQEQNPEQARRRGETWRDRIENSGGQWQLVDDIAALAPVFEG
jgi:hypothetical protein